jgi:acetylornithine deacetylase/succinyl-diaminopimelate desuccinylase-like protein
MLVTSSAALLIMTTSSIARERKAIVSTGDKRVARALELVDRNGAWMTQQQIRITEVSAPTFHEQKRAELLRKVFESAGLKPRIDSTGNVVAEYAGADPNSVILVAAHLDTVFPEGTDVHVRQRGARLEAPGIGDNGAGLAGLTGIAHALHDSKLRTQSTIVLAADVGEEGEGNLRGIRALVAEYSSQLRAVIAVDGFATDYVTARALGSQRVEITVTGPGGHSWSDFGLPNPITALSRGIVRFSAARIPDSPRTTFNFGMISGGTSVNSIPASASVQLDVRSESDAEIARLMAAARKAFQRGNEEEMDAAGHTAALALKYRELGSRPSGALSENSPLLAAAREADRALGNISRLEISSTDANAPLSMGIPAIALGAGGSGGGTHTLQEWYDSSGREMGVKRVLLTLVNIAGLAQ